MTLHPRRLHVLASCVGLASCVSSGSGQPQAAPTIGSRAGQGTPRLASPTENDGPVSARELTGEVVRLIEQFGAIYLEAADGCEEWQARRDRDRVHLALLYYPFDDGGARRRHRQERAIRIAPSGLAIDAQRVWVEEKYDRRTSTWREVDSAAGGNLCVADAAVQRIERGFHYAIGGAHLYFSRRACEDDIPKQVGRTGC